MNDKLLNNLGEVETGDELYLIRRKGTKGVTNALRRILDREKNTECLYLFTTRFKAIVYLNYLSIDDPDLWEVVSSKEFGGVLALLKQASSISTHVAFDPPSGNVLIPTPTIEDTIRIIESWQAEESNSGGRQTPFWELVLKKDKHTVYALQDNTGDKIFPLFKNEMDAEEFINSYGLSDEWEADGPMNPVKGIDFLEHLRSKGFFHVVINPPLNGDKGFTATPIKAVITNLKEKGHIRDL